MAELGWDPGAYIVSHLAACASKVLELFIVVAWVWINAAEEVFLRPCQHNAHRTICVPDAGGGMGIVGVNQPVPDIGRFRDFQVMVLPGLLGHGIDGPFYQSHFDLGRGVHSFGV